MLWLTLTHFGTIAGHLWLVRLIVVGLKVICVFMPIAGVDRYSYLAHDWGWFGSLGCIWPSRLFREPFVPPAHARV